ncbi:MAG TPA: hypothetical protein PKD78_03490, partial [Saprospiraceae bacterium]|nr:hypothetical protein [Saprospiraceae bacterium]
IQKSTTQNSTNYLYRTLSPCKSSNNAWGGYAAEQLARKPNARPAQQQARRRTARNPFLPHSGSLGIESLLEVPGRKKMTIFVLWRAGACCVGLHT